MVRAVRSMLLLAVLALPACALFVDVEEPTVALADIRPISLNLLEQRFAVDLRVTNPNDFPLILDGLAVALAVNDHPFASGVGDGRYEIPRLSEGILTLSVASSLDRVVDQVTAMLSSGRIDYALEGHTFVELHGRHKVRFDDTGSYDASAQLAAAFLALGRLLDLDGPAR